MPAAEPSQSRLAVNYHLRADAEVEARAFARDIALEQTVELPPGTFPQALEARVAGRLEGLDQVAEGRWRAVISYDPVVAGGELPQLLNLLFGNISLKTGIRVAAIHWPESMLAAFPGPRLGISGLRDLCAVAERRPLLCVALKPVGLSAPELGELCYQFALGGVDIIKDDHGLSDQSPAPLCERLERCQDAVARAADRTGERSLYFPNLTSRFSELPRNLDAVREAGCRGVLISPLLVGLDTLRWLAETSGVAILAHPSLSGAFFAADHGIAPEVLLGDIFRIAGSDGVIYPNAGGRFPFSEATCVAINQSLRQPLGLLRPAFPVPAGGIDVDRVPHWIERYGPDTIFLIGGSLYAQPDLRQASRRLLETIGEHSHGPSVACD
jgi:ribulose-bisphosphate carboxylase large chain